MPCSAASPLNPTWTNFIEWLVAEADPDDRHRVMMAWNWGGDTAVPDWICSRPDCDRSTALLTFWNASPEYYLQNDGDRSRIEPFALADFDLAFAVRERWQAGAYERAELAFSLDDPATWPRDFEKLDADFGARSMIDMPFDMRIPIDGRVLDADDYPEGIPARLWVRDQPTATDAPAVGDSADDPVVSKRTD